MFVSECLSVAQNGNLAIGGVDVLTLTEKYGTPLYIMDEDNIRKTCREYVKAMRDNFGDKGIVAYASKAFCTTYMYKILSEEGLSSDVVSAGEIYTAVKAGFDMSKTYFHGNNKTIEEIEMALQYGVGRIIVDNKEELALLNSIAGEKNVRAKIMFRIKPGIDAHTHEAIMTGQIDSKFGVALENGEALDIMKLAATLPNVEVVGMHCHIGSQIFGNDAFMEAAKVMMNFAKKLQDEVGITISELNLGGGFGIRYTEVDDPKSPTENIEHTARALKEESEKLGIDVPSIIVEPGRSIVAPSGITAYTVGSVKEIKDVRTYVAIDGGMTDNPRYALYESRYTLLKATAPTADATLCCTIAGKCCESGDLIGKDINIPPVKAGDVICTLATGAYNYSMSSNYNRNPRPACVMVSGGKDKLVIKRETYDYLIENDVF